MSARDLLEDEALDRLSEHFDPVSGTMLDPLRRTVSFWDAVHARLSSDPTKTLDPRLEAIWDVES